MAIRLIVAITDQEWFDFLRHQRLPEVNFWAPSSPTNFGALIPGELFLFKLHAPHNFIVGGGTFTHASVLPCSLAWEAFREANGAPTFESMRNRIAQYRKADRNDRSDFEIGCRALSQPFFFDEADWIPVPPSWSPQIQRFKRYDTSTSDGLSIWESVQSRLAGGRSATPLEPKIEEGLRERYGQPYLVNPRLGQGAFRVLVTDAYQRRCAVTAEKTLPALEAAHIRPYSLGGPHDAQNGLLLRRDIHSLFDSGYVTVTPDLRFEVSRHVRDDYGNGRHYYALHGQHIEPPKNPSFTPDPKLLAWHNDNRFKG